MPSVPADPSGTPGRYAKGIARRQEILDKSIEVFAKRGSTKISLRAIAEEIGVTHGALTHYFGSLEELLVAVYQEHERRSDSEHPETPADVSPAMMMRVSAEENRNIPGLIQLYSTLVASALQDDHPAANEFATQRFARLRREMIERVRLLQSSGRLRDDLDPALVSALVIAASDGLQTQWLLDATVDHEAALEMLDSLLTGERRRD